jgi:predicted short-subunit dehydrogenase-like oxidoreductase (DUF2520 family)
VSVTSPARIGFVGAGRAGGALAAALAAAGWPVVVVASRTAASAQALAARLPRARALPDAQAVADAADLVFLTVPDAVIADVAGALAWRPGQAVVHTSGADSLGPLAPAARAGALVGCLHPLQTFSGDATGDPGSLFIGTTCALEGDDALLPLLDRLTRSLGARPIVLPAEAKARYHAAAVLAANYVVTLLHLAADLWASFGVPAEVAVEALLPLTRRAVENVGEQGTRAALTGPIARGDALTLEKHLAALAAARPATVAPYAALARATLALARERGDLSAEQLAALEAAITSAERAATGAAVAP